MLSLLESLSIEESIDEESLSICESESVPVADSGSDGMVVAPADVGSGAGAG
jgi:hypothetical protein